MGIRGVELIIIDPKHIDPRGAVFEPFVYRGEEYPYHSIYYRRFGAKSTYHFHKGTNKSKDPEINLLLLGTLELIARNKFGEELREVITNHGVVHNGVGIPAIIIAKEIPHQTFFRISNSIVIELLKEKFDHNHNLKDFYPEKEFDDHIRRQYG